MPNTWGYGGSSGVLTGYLHKYSGQGNFVLVMIAPEEYGVEDFEVDADIWSATDSAKTTVWRYTSDPAPRNSVMAVQGKSWTLGDGVKLGDGYYLGDSPQGKGEGAYKDYSVQEKVIYVLNCLYRVPEVGTLTIQLYDQTNGAEISSKNVTDSSWNSAMLQITAPENCTTIRIKFIQKADSQRPGPFLIDNVSLDGNILRRDPDGYERIPMRIGTFHQTLSGRRIYDIRAFHYEFLLHWTLADSEEYENLRSAYFSNELLYFNDGDVPALRESDVVYENVGYDYQGITNPSGTHKAYSDSSSSLPSGKTDFETTEFSTADYQAIDEDDSSYKETADPSVPKYLYHKFLILSSIVQSGVQRLRVRIACLSEDTSTEDVDGCILYGWNGASWVEMASSSNSSKNYLEYSAVEPEVAREFVDSSDNYIRLLIRSQYARQKYTESLSLRTHYVECEINEDLDLIIELSHKAILNENDDVIWVKNLTQGTTLVKDTDYTIATDRRSVTISGQTSSDEIEVKYNRYFEVMFGSLPEEWLNRDANTNDRDINIILETLSESK